MSMVVPPSDLGFQSIPPETAAALLTTASTDTASLGCPSLYRIPLRVWTVPPSCATSGLTMPEVVISDPSSISGFSSAEPVMLLLGSSFQLVMEPPYVGLAAPRDCVDPRTGARGVLPPLTPSSLAITSAPAFFMSTISLCNVSTVPSSDSMRGTSVAIADSLYLPKQSVSMLSLSPTSLLGTTMCFWVYSMSINVNQLSLVSTSHTVRLVPSMAMNPLGTM
mmetsp:Transcript_8374/g.19823  ORF Transcript_8374/g.19823 Transcript_8374/m.19823 type:complete len:222 (-) Transcript_8374:333-998(-)